MIAHSEISEKQKAILNASLQLFVEYGFHGTPTSKIATEAGIAHGTIFTYYKTKDDLIAALYEYTKSQLRDYLTINVSAKGTLKERFRDIFFYSVKWSLANRKEFYFTQQFQYSPHLKKTETESNAKEQSLHRAIYREGLENGFLKPLPLNMITELSMSQMVGIYNFLSKEHLSKKKEAEVIDETFELLWNMLKKE